MTVVSVQNLYNLGDRKHDDVVDYCTKEKLGFIPWFPMAAGDLAKEGGVLDSAAKKHGATVSQLALAWLLHRSPVILPIPGNRLRETSGGKHGRRVAQAGRGGVEGYREGGEVAFLGSRRQEDDGFLD